MSNVFSGSMQSPPSGPRLSPKTHRTEGNDASGVVSSFSKHAVQRMREYGLTRHHVALIIRHGIFHRARYDRLMYEIPDSPFLAIGEPKLEEVRNLSLVLSSDGTVISVYRKDSRFREGELK